jgi:rod shape-determining protein MreC
MKISDLLTHKKTVFIIAAVLIVIILSLSSIFKNSFGHNNFLSPILYPVHKIIAYVYNNIRTIPTSISKVKNLSSENIELKKENKKLKKKLKNLQYKIEIINDKDLINLLNYRKKQPFKTVMAEIIVRDPSNWYKTIWIDKGLADGIQKNYPVITDKGVVGKIIQTKILSSQILLLSDTASNISAVVKETKNYGIITGTLANDCVMKYIDTNTKVNVGQEVITSGMSNIFPKSLYIGKISRVHAEDTHDNFLKVRVTLGVNFSKLENVMVILKNKN